MSISPLTAVATNTDAANPLIATLPTGIINNTLLLMIVTQDINNGSLSSTPTGWTLVDTEAITNGDHQTVYLLSRLSDGTDGSTVTVTPTAASHNMGSVVGGWNVIDTTSGAFGPGIRDYNVTNPNLSSAPASPVTISAGSVTPNSGDYLVILGSVDTTGGNGVYSGFPAAYTSLVQTSSSDSFNSAFLAQGPAAGAGATGSQSGLWTQSGSNGNYVAWAIAIKGVAGAAALQVSSLSAFGIGPG